MGYHYAGHPARIAGEPSVQGDRDGTPSWICDNVLIGPDGGAERLHRFPPDVVELG